MPIYEFRCVECGAIQEFLTTGASQEIEMKCKECGAEELERVLSTVSYSMGSSGASQGSCTPGQCCGSTTRSCGPGQSCTTMTLPGHSRD